MKVNLYLHEDNFTYNGEDEEESLKDRFSRLIQDLSLVSKEKDASLCVSQSFANACIYREEDIFTFAERALPEEYKGFFYALWDQDNSPVCATNEELKLKTVYHPDETECNAIVVLNECDSSEEDKKNYIRFDVYEIIYNRQNWTILQRQILGNHPENGKAFVEKCKKCFDRLRFGDVCAVNVTESLDTSSRRIVYYLSCINDRFLSFLSDHPEKKNPNSILADFSGQYGMDKAASLQRSAENKKNYTFGFSEEGKEYVCDAHFKIQHPDGDGKSRDIARIYIYYGSGEHPEAVIRVGSMGKYHA